MKMKEENKKNIAVIIGLSFTILISLMAVSYAAYSILREGTKENELVTGTLRLAFNEGLSNDIDIDPAIPLSDTDGLSQEPYTFALRNTGTSAATYRIKMIKKTVRNDNCTQIPWEKIRVQITKDGQVIAYDYLSNIEYFDTGDINPTPTGQNGIVYTLKIWIDEKAGNEIMGQHFHGAFELDAIVQGHTNWQTGE